MNTTTNTLLNKGEEITKTTSKTLKTLEIMFEGKYYYIEIDEEGECTIDREGINLCSIGEGENYKCWYSSEVNRVLEYLDSIGEYDLS